MKALQRARRMRASAAAIALSLACTSCASGPSRPSPSVAPGVWGGDHLTMTVAAGGAHLEFDCAHGDVPAAFAVDGRGEFSAAGVYVREHGGPIRENEPPDVHPAAYEGRVTADTMTLTVRIPDLAATLGPFLLTYGSPGRVVKCL